MPRGGLWHALACWAWLGFAGGAGVLLLVATPIEQALKDAAAGQSRINLVLGLVALAWIGVSALLSWVLARRLMGSRLVWLLHAAGLAACLAVFTAFLQSGAGVMARFQGGTQVVGSRFTFGPYPDADRMAGLGREGFTGVISLLSPVVPFEAVLLGQERAAAAAAGLELIEAPMLPWVSENRSSLDRIRALASAADGRYYVHCYLGRHRADLARDVIETTVGRVDASRLATRLRPRFSRGALVRVGPYVVLGPRPTKDEWFPPLVRAGFRRVVAIDLENAALIDEERGWAATYGVTFQAVDVSGGYAALASDLAAAAEPVYVHAFRPDERIGALLTELERLMPGTVRRVDADDTVGVLAADAAPAAAADLSLPAAFERGPITRVGTVVVGPFPTPGEWEDFVGPSGLRFVVSMLDPEDPSEATWIAKERTLADVHGLTLALVPVRRPTAVWPAVRAARRLGAGVYLHGWAGEDRVQEALGILTAAFPVPAQIERGPVTEVRPGLYAGPIPTSDDWFGGLARAGVTTVVCLLDPAKPDEATWIAQLEDITAAAGATLVVNPPAGHQPPDSGRTYVHGFAGDDPRLPAYLAGLRR
jgi:hypothetical protein